MTFIAYKAFNRDKTFSGVDYFEKSTYEMEGKYVEGETYEIECKPEVWQSGFCFDKDLVLCLFFCPIKERITENLYAEVEILGDVDFTLSEHRGYTNKIKIVRFLSDEEVLEMVDSNFNSGKDNSGNYNSGNKNSGDYNSGNYNSGHCNSGDNNSGNKNYGDDNTGIGNLGGNNTGNYNLGDRNSGDYNSGIGNSGFRNFGYYNSGSNNLGNFNSGNWNQSNCNSGHLNTIDPEYIYVFNKPCLKSDWDNTDIPYFMNFRLLKDKSYKECFIESYNKADLEDKKKVLKLPNFDKDVFFDISGIDVSDIM